MDYPKRAQSHITETASFKRLEACVPNEWIVRYASERDYGIDTLIEPVSNVDRLVKGDLMAIQVKGTGALKWNEDGKTAIFSGIDVTAVNYWMSLPVPVFLCVHDQSTNALYYSQVKLEVRRRYNELLTQKTFGFELSKSFNLADTEGHKLFMAFYFMEKAQPHFESALLDLLINRDTFINYIRNNFQRDPFFEVETPELIRFNQLYSNTSSLVFLTGEKWDVPRLDDIYAQDRKDFPKESAFLHEFTQARVLRQLVPHFIKALEIGCHIVTKLEPDYWKAKNPLLVNLVIERGVDNWIDEARTELAFALSEKDSAG